MVEHATDVIVVIGRDHRVAPRKIACALEAGFDHHLVKPVALDAPMPRLVAKP